MNLKSSGVWKGIIAFSTIALIVGCAPKAYLTAGSVPNPVLLGGPSHIKTENKVLDVQVVPMRVAVSQDVGKVRVTSEAVKDEDADKAAKAIAKITQNNETLDVQLYKLSVGAYYYDLGNLSVMKNWVHIKGGLSETGKEVK